MKGRSYFAYHSVQTELIATITSILPDIGPYHYVFFSALSMQWWTLLGHAQQDAVADKYTK